MTKLNDAQSVLLATAAQRDSGSLYPLPETLTSGARVAHAVRYLTASTLVVERGTTNSAAIHRADRNLSFGLFITPAGLQAIGIEPEAGDQLNGSSEPHFTSLPLVASGDTKVSQLLALLSCANGATLAELIEKFEWLPHSIRAALTGLRKKGHAIERSKRGNQTCYRVVEDATK